MPIKILYNAKNQKRTILKKMRVKNKINTSINPPASVNDDYDRSQTDRNVDRESQGNLILSSDVSKHEGKQVKRNEYKITCILLSKEKFN